MRRDKLEKLLANDPDIQYVTPERPMKGSLYVSTQTIEAYSAWNSGYDGTGIGVAVIDSGIADSIDLDSPATGNTRVVYGESFLTSDPKNAKDAFGHGTHVAGIVATARSPLLETILM
jgi:serine protease AprX